MNKSQRDKNRQTHRDLHTKVRYIESMRHTCEECGEPGYHWIGIRGLSLMAMITGVDDQEGFWTCAKFYGPDGRRLADVF